MSNTPTINRGRRPRLPKRPVNVSFTTTVEFRDHKGKVIFEMPIDNGRAINLAEGDNYTITLNNVAIAETGDDTFTILVPLTEF